MIASVTANLIFVLVTAVAIAIVVVPLARAARRRARLDGHQGNGHHETSSQPR
jgi:hypothetical protein